MFYNDSTINLVNPDNWDASKPLEHELSRKLADTLGLDNVAIEKPADSTHGDFSTNIAMQNAKELGKNPRELAEEYLSKINSDELFKTYLEKSEIAGPGFINFFLKKEAYLNELEKFAKFSSELKLPILLQKTIMLEYAHPNPFKSFHIGHLRNIVLGESLVRILEALGARVVRVNYQGDVGMHIAKSIWAMMKNVERGTLNVEQGTWSQERETLSGERGAEGAESSQESNNSDVLSAIKFEDMTSYEKARLIGEMYAKGATAFEEDDVAKEEIKKINFAIYTIQQNKFIQDHPEWTPMKKYQDFLEEDSVNLELIEQLYELGKSWSLDEFHRLYERLGSHFEREFMESETLYLSDLKVREAEEKGILKKSEGALIFDGEEYGLETRVFLNSLGLPTYEGKELGLAELQFSEFGEINVCIHNVAVEQKSFFKATFKVEELLDPEKYKGKQYHNAYEFVGLKSGKMSSRKGKVVLAEDILNTAKEKLVEKMTDKEIADREDTLEKIAIAAVKYSFLNLSPFTYLAFDIDASLNFEGDSGPYLLYTYTRGNKLLKDYGDVVEIETSNLRALDSKHEVALIKHIAGFESAIIDAGKSLSPNALTNYLFVLAQHFNQFYKNSPILNEENEMLKEARLALTKLTTQVLKQGLYLLGIETVERM